MHYNWVMIYSISTGKAPLNSSIEWQWNLVVQSGAMYQKYYWSDWLNTKLSSLTTRRCQGERETHKMAKCSKTRSRMMLPSLPDGFKATLHWRGEWIPAAFAESLDPSKKFNWEELNGSHRVLKNLNLGQWPPLNPPRIILLFSLFTEYQVATTLNGLLFRWAILDTFKMNSATCV